MPKTVFVAHPMTGDLEGNIARVVAICREIHSLEILPVFPSFTTRRYLTDKREDRILAANQIETYMARGFVDELWLYGEYISGGMWWEIRLAREYNIPVLAKTPNTVMGLVRGEPRL